MTTVAKILIDDGSELEFSYAVPEALREKAVPGARVRVPLRGRNALGTVVAVAEESAAETEARRYALKEIAQIAAGEASIPPKLIDFARWVADYYCATTESVVRTMLPQKVRAGEESAKIRKQVRLVAELPADELAELERRAPRQAAIIRQLAAAPGKAMLLSELGGAEASAKGLAERGIAAIEEVALDRDPDEGVEFIPTAPMEPTAEQAAALRIITEAIEWREWGDDPPKPILLHGVTGSGKTEIYLQAAQRALDLGKSALVLVPEIALTPQTVDRFKGRFAELGAAVAVLHSSLSDGERHDEWFRVARGQARIVIGARSAIFAPLENIGLIIVDEEHEGSYKQDINPRYHARDLAVVRAGLEGAACLLGSATPSLESFQNVARGKYQLAELRERVDGRSLPIIRVIDMRQESRRTKVAEPSILSARLRRAMEQRLERGEQIILFLNRRGFASSIVCLACGTACECDHCSVPLTYHQGDERLICHICGFRRVPPKRCRECGDPSVRFAGFGTEKVEEVMRKVFPQARIARVDADTTRRKGRLREILTEFKAHKLDLLLGTQMIAKGLDFPGVTLVGIINADIGLHIPDFRAGERTFQILTQVAGRAGRGELEGEVVVQSYAPHSPSIQFARHHDFGGFADQEMEIRAMLGYPPFARCVLVSTRSTNERLAEFTLENLHLRLKKEFPEDAYVGDPNPSPLVRAMDQYRFQFLVRHPRIRALTDPLKAVLKGMTFPEEVYVGVDVDPLSLS